MKRLLFVLTFALFLSANEQNQTLALTHGEPSSLVEGCVSAITGGLYLNQADVVVKGAEPIEFTRQYVSDHYMDTHIGWHFCGISSASHLKFGIYFLISDGRGIYLDFYIDDLHKANELIKKKQVFPLVLAPGWLDAAISNSANHEISARTNLYNMRAEVTHDRNWIRLYLPDGGERHYEVVKNTKKDSSIALDYMLSKEIKPNRNIIRYEYAKDGNLLKISSHSPDEKTTYAWIKVRYHGDVKKLKDFTITTSDGQEREYCFETVDYLEPSLHVHKKYWKKYRYLLELYRSNTTPNETIAYRSFISEIKLPDGRYRSFDYDDKHRVKHIYGPVGPDGKKQALYTFRYGDKKTDVYDSLGNKVQYSYNGRYRLTYIHRYQGSDELINIEQFTWGKNDGLDATLLKARSLLDSEEKPIHSRQFIYDNKGNPIEERYFGTITGTGGALQLKEGIPVAESGDCAITKRKYSSDNRNLLIQEIHPSGLITEMAYHPGTDLIKSRIHKQGTNILKREFFFYDKDYRLVEEVVDDGYEKDYQQHAIGSYRIHTRYDLLKTGPFIGMPKTIIKSYLDQESPHLKLISVEELVYDKFGNVSKRNVYDANQIKRFTLQQIYDASNRLQKAVNALGEAETFAFDANNNLIRHQLADGSQKTYKYDKANRLLQTAHDSHRDIYQYNSKSQQIAHIDYLKNKTAYQYDALGNCIQTTGPPAPISPITITNYTPDSHPKIITDANGYKTTTTYNIYGKPLLIKHPDSTSESFTYDISGNLLTHTNQIGTLTSYTYDIFGRVLSKTTENHTEVYTYDTFKLLQKVDPEGNITIYQYDSAGRKIAEIQNQEGKTYTYDPLGRLHKTIHSNNLIEITEYDDLDRVIENRSEGPDGQVYSKTYYAYDSNGNKIATYTFVGAKNTKAAEKCTYDAFNRQTSQTDPLGNITIIDYLEKDRHLIKTTTNPKGLRTIEIYNPLNQLMESRLEDPSGNKLNNEIFAYDPSDNKLSQTSTIYAPTGSRSTTTQWKYDPKNRPTQTIEATGTDLEKTTHIAYTPSGKKATITKPNGITLSHQYDTHDRLNHLTSSDGSIDYIYTYNKLSQVIAVDDAIQNTKTVRKWDPKGRLLYERLGNGLELSSQYDCQGRRTQLRLSNGHIEYTYNPAHLTSVNRYDQSGHLLYTHSYEEHDLSENILSESLIFDLGKTKYQPNKNSIPISYKTPFYEHKITELDPNSNVLKATQKLHDTVTESYTYNILDHLLDEQNAFTHTYDYDSHHNRILHNDKTYQINALNQLNEIIYDVNGNPIQVGDKTCKYDALDRLVEVSHKGTTHTYIYDYLHRRITTNQAEHYIYDNKNEIGLADKDLKITQFRVLGEGQGAEIGASIALELNGTTYVPLHDLYGNIKALIDQEGNICESYDYDSFGQHQVLDCNVENPWRYQSKRLDPTDFVYFGRRYYMPDLGRFLTPDPMGLSEGPNLYQYLHNSPLLNYDEYGLAMMYGQPMSFPSSRSIREYSSLASHSMLQSFSNQFSQVTQFYQESASFSRMLSPWRSGAENQWISTNPTDRFFNRVDSWHAKIDQLFSTNFKAGFSPISSNESSVPITMGMMPDPNGILRHKLQPAGIGKSSTAIQPHIILSNEAKHFASQYLANPKNHKEFTRSSMRLGQKMHRKFKLSSTGIKEFRLNSGRRIDFLDINNKTIYELKPHNPRAIRQGYKQLLLYKEELQQSSRFQGIDWNIQLETY